MSEPTLKGRRAILCPLDIFSRTGEKSQDERVLQPYRHMAQNLNRRNFTMIIDAYNYWFNVPKEKLVAIDDILRIIYNAGLLIDDIEDRSTLRRGSPVAHSIYGAPSTLAAAHYALNVAIDRILNFVEAEQHTAETTRAIAEMFVQGFGGQGLEIYWKENFICPTEEEYCHMCETKSNGLFNLITCLMSSCSGRKGDFSKFNNLLAGGFQIVNDYENFTSKESFKRKTFCDDITEGKFTLPIIHAIRSHPEDHQIIDILALGTTNYKLKQHCLNLMQKFGSLEYTRKRIAHIREEIIHEAKRFGENPQMGILITFALGRKE